jgi:hypothetical protein
VNVNSLKHPNKAKSNWGQALLNWLRITLPIIINTFLDFCKLISISMDIGVLFFHEVRYQKLLPEDYQVDLRPFEHKDSLT